MSDAFVKTLDAAREMGYDIPGAKPRVTAESSGPTVIDAIRALDSVCDGAETKDGAGFSKFDREEKGDLIEKAVSEGHLSPKEEKKAYGFLKKYKKQLKGLGVDYDNIGHINSAIEDEEKESGAASLVKLVPFQPDFSLK